MLKFSIITVTYNSSDTLRDTMNSVLAQTYIPYEYIIIDGMSKDNTVEIARSYINDFKDKGISLRIISEKDDGLYDAMNKGIRISKGDVIGIINSDDWYEPSAIENAVKVFTENEEIGIVHGLVRRIRHDGYGYLMAGKNIKRLPYYMCLNHPTFFVRKAVYDKLGAFDLRYKSSADYDFALRAYLAGIIYHKVEEVMANMRLGGISDLKYKDGLKEKMKIQKQNGIPFLSYTLSYIVFYFKHMIVNFLVSHDINYQKIIKKKI